jgi:uncharacterized protein YbgA (DUF1722 family)
MAHSPRAYTSLGQMVARAKRSPRDTFAARYEQEFMTALAERATARRHTNVLEHCLGYFRDRLDAKARREILSVVQDYRAGLVPLVVPITMIRHYVRTLDVGYLAGQVYLEPHPKELMLRNHV